LRKITRKRAKEGGKKTAFISLSGSFCDTASVLGNEKNKEEIFTLFVIIIVLHNIHLLILFFEVPQSAADIKIENVFQNEIKINEQGKSSK